MPGKCSTKSDSCAIAAAVCSFPTRNSSTTSSRSVRFIPAPPMLRDAGPWGSLVSYQLGVLATGVQIATDPPCRIGTRLNQAGLEPCRIRDVQVPMGVDIGPCLPNQGPEQDVRRPGRGLRCAFLKRLHRGPRQGEVGVAVKAPG